MEDFKKLMAIHDIRNVCARRIRAMDLKDWDAYAAVHAEDAWSEAYSIFSPDNAPPDADGKNRVIGAQALADALRHSLTHKVPVTTVHHVHEPEIELTSDSTASAIWPMEHKGWWRNGVREEHLQAYGHYHETYRKVDGQWLIASRSITYLRMDRTAGYFDRLSTWCEQAEP
jgi:hypothetical protein